MFYYLMFYYLIIELEKMNYFILNCKFYFDSYYDITNNIFMRKIT